MLWTELSKGVNKSILILIKSHRSASFGGAQSLTTLDASLCLVQWEGGTHTHVGNPPTSGKAGAARTEVCKFWRLSREFEAQEAKVHFWLKLRRVKLLYLKSISFLVTRAHGLSPASKSRCAAHGLQVESAVLRPTFCLGCMTNGLAPCAGLHTCWLKGRPSVDIWVRVFGWSVCSLNIQVVVYSTSWLVPIARRDKESKKSFNELWRKRF